MTKNEPVDPARDPESPLRHESGLVQRSRRFLQSSFRDQVPHIVAGYSGGKDSLALLLVFRELRRLGVCRLTAVHVDHGLRPDSAEDARGAMRVAEELGVTCVLKTAQVNLRQAFPGQSVEDIARRFRYQSLAQVLSDVGGDAIAVGHHRQDQAETVMLHLLRGSGLSGLKGMVPDGLLPVSSSPTENMEPDTLVRVIRPFLHEDPSLLLEIVQRSGLGVFEDPSNVEPSFRRNRLRHELLPLMEDIAPGAASQLVSLADIVHEDDLALDDIAHALLERSLDGEALLWDYLQNAPQGLQRRVVRHWLLHFGKVSDLSLDRVDAVVQLGVRREGGKRVEIGEGWQVRFAKGRLEIVRP